MEKHYKIFVEVGDYRMGYGEFACLVCTGEDYAAMEGLFAILAQSDFATPALMPREVPTKEAMAAMWLGAWLEMEVCEDGKSGRIKSTNPAHRDCEYVEHGNHVIEMINFILGGSIGTMRKQIGHSKWFCQSTDGISFSITEKVGRETVSAVYDDCAENCLRTFMGIEIKGL